MPLFGKSKDRTPGYYKSDLREARPLLQAIFFGMLLATALVVAAAMANPNDEKDSVRRIRPGTENSIPHPDPASNLRQRAAPGELY